MAKENPQASDENELEIGVEEEEKTDSSSSESESESESVEEETSKKRKFESLEEDWFDDSFIVRQMVSFGVSEDSVKEGWSMLPVESKKKMEEEWKVLQAKEFEYLLFKAKFLYEVLSKNIAFYFFGLANIIIVWPF